MPDKLTLRENWIIESWENRKLHDLQEKNEIQVMEEQGRSWPTGEKWNPDHGETGKTMTYRRKMKSRSWGTRECHDLQEKNEIQIMEEQGMPWSSGRKWNSDHRENGSSMIRRFCLFRRINLLKLPTPIRCVEPWKFNISANKKGINLFCLV